MKRPILRIDREELKIRLDVMYGWHEVDAGIAFKIANDNFIEKESERVVKLLENHLRKKKR